MRFRSFPGNPGGESGGVVLYSTALPAFSGIKPKGWYAAEVLWKQSVVSSSPGPAAGGRRRASLSLLRFWKAGVLPRRPAPGPGGARRRRLRARRKPAPLLLEARPGLPALLAAPGGAQGGQALLLRAPPAGRAERPCRAPDRLRIRPAAQQLLGKVGLLRTAAAAGTEQRAAPPAATVQRDALPIYALCPAWRTSASTLTLLTFSPAAA